MLRVMKTKRHKQRYKTASEDVITQNILGLEEITAMMGLQNHKRCGEDEQRTITSCFS